jgi:choline dehydrogenase-like flavoprotein
MNDYYFGDVDFEYPMGNVQMVGKSSAQMYRGEKPIETKLAPTLALSEVAEHAVDFWLSTEDLPRPDNRVTLAEDGSIVLSYTPNNRQPMEQLYHRVKKHLSHMGMHSHHLIPRDAYTKNDIPIAGCAHQAGTVRFGTDPATSVLDPQLQGARSRQPLCRRHQLLPQHRSREPGADRDGQRTSGG